MNSVTAGWARLRKLFFGIAIVGCAIWIIPLLWELPDRALEHLICGMEMQNEFASPASTHVAVVWIYDCGATTAFVTRVSIMPHGRQFAHKTYPPFLSVHGYHEIAPQWHDNTQLFISVPKNERIYIQEQPDAVVVTYAE